MYTGPSGNPLLPSDFEDPLSSDSQTSDDLQETNEDNHNEEDDTDNDDTLDNQENSSGIKSDWTTAKTNMSKYASGNSINYRRAVSSHIKAYGGSSKAAKSASSGIKSTQNFGRFLFNSSSLGIRETLSQFKIDFEGKAAREILAEVINQIAPLPVTKEDSVARMATIRTMEILYEKIEDENKDISTLDKINKELLNEMIPIHIESYIYERIINDLGSRIEEYSSSPADAVNKEKEIKEYINSMVEVALKDKDFSKNEFNNDVGEKVESLYSQCYKVMEDML